MDTRDLRCFRLVYEEGSINKAANQLFITPQGLSRIIRKLEDEFQTSLFKRTTSGTIPTKSGDYLFTHSQDLLFQMENIKREMIKINNRPNTLHVGFACGTLQVLHLEQLFDSNFQVQWEEIENDEVSEKLMNHTLDIGFIIGSNSHAELVSTEVYTGKMNALVYEGHPFYNKQLLHIEDLKEQPLITLNEKYFTYHSLIQRCSDFGFTPNILMSTMESQLIYRFCAQKLGIGIDADIHKNNDILSEIRKIEIEDAIPWKISLVYHKNFGDKEIIRSFKQNVTRACPIY